MVPEGEGIRAQGRPPRRLQLKQRPPLAPLIALETPGPGPPPFPLSSRAVGPRTNNHKARQRPDRGLMRVAHLGSPREPGDRLLTQLRPLTVTRAGDSLAATKCRELGVADSSACRASLKKAEGGGDTRVRRVRPPGSPRELITADAPWCGPRHPQVHARLPASPTHNAPPGTRR